MVTTLNSRQLLFAQNVVKGMSLTDAYRQAGYTGEGHVAHAGASKLMQKPAVAGYVGACQQQSTLSTVASRTEILKKLTTVLRSDVTDLDSLPVHEVTRRTVLRSDGTRSTVVRSKSMSRHAALRQLARMLDIGNPPTNQDRYERYRQRSALEARATVIAAIGEEPTPIEIPPDPDAGPIRIGRHLNTRQRLFCEYLARDYPAHSAYGFAGYQISPHASHVSAAASRLLKRPAVIAYLRELRRHTPIPDLAGDLASRDETLAYLTQALRATRPEIETQARFIDQVVQDEVEKPDGSCETRVVVRSISQPRIIALLAGLLSSTTPRQQDDDDDQYAASIHAELAELFASQAEDQPKPR